MLKEGEPLTLIEIAEKLEKKPKEVFKSLRKLFESNEIISDPTTKHYMLAKKE
ncbi:hypothetical protein MUP77_09440 [Candidatus Bathyarchaeota archaeon]|nr:hypothetical protein [Candidatus Bathyarchaeota archaeon]